MSVDRGVRSGEDERSTPGSWSNSCCPKILVSISLTSLTLTAISRRGMRSEAPSCQDVPSTVHTVNNVNASLPTIELSPPGRRPVRVTIARANRVCIRFWEPGGVLAWRLYLGFAPRPTIPISGKLPIHRRTYSTVSPWPRMGHGSMIWRKAAIALVCQRCIEGHGIPGSPTADHCRAQRRRTGNQAAPELCRWDALSTRQNHQHVARGESQVRTEHLTKILMIACLVASKVGREELRGSFFGSSRYVYFRQYTTTINDARQ